MQKKLLNINKKLPEMKLNVINLVRTIFLALLCSFFLQSTSSSVSATAEGDLNRMII
jgi:hypothetical protein